MNRAGRWIAVITGVAAAIPAAAELPTYRVTYLGPSSVATAMNELGDAVGWTVDGGFARGWIYTDRDGWTLLPLPEGWNGSIAYDLNDAGVVVGKVALSTLGEPGTAAMWTPTEDGYEVTVLGYLSGHAGSVATAVNVLGDIVGYSFVPGFSGGPATLFSDPGGLVNLAAANGFAAAPTDINDARQIVGGQLRLDLDTGVVENLGVPEGTAQSYVWTNAYAINENGQVAGYGQLATSGHDDQRAVRYTDGVGWIELDALPSPYGSAYGINDGGDVSFETPVQLYFQGDGRRSPESLLHPDDAAWVILQTMFDNDINDARQVLVMGTNPETSQSGAIRLDPVTSVGVPNESPTAAEMSLAVQPNPFRAATALRFELDEPATVRLAVFDVTGRRVRTLTRGWADAGHHALTWDGTNARGVAVGAGIYYLRLEVGDAAATRRVVLID